MGVGHLYLILLVAPRIASVTFSAWPVNIEYLGQFVAVIKEHHSKHAETNVRDGATLVDNVALGKCLLAQEDINAKTKGKGCSGTNAVALTTSMPPNMGQLYEQ